MKMFHSEPDRISLDKGWLFKLNADDHLVLPEADETGFAAVRLPHDWQIDRDMDPEAPGKGTQGFLRREEKGIYRLHLYGKPEWAGKEVRVLFDGVQHFSTVYLNGREIAAQKYGYVPFSVLLEELRIGEDNVLSVLVDNTVTGEHWYGAGADRWYSGAGIYRHAWLLVDEPTHFVHDGLRVSAVPVFRGPCGDVPDVAGIRCERADVSVTVEVAAPTAGDSIRLTVTAPDGSEVLTETAAATDRTQTLLRIPSPTLWNTEHPACYLLTAELLRNGQVLDCIRSTFGVRSAVFDTEDGFLLNGTKTKLWGVNFHHDGGAVGAAVPIEVWRRRFIELKKLGVNTIRCSHNPQAEEFYTLCDEMGFLVIDEFCDKWQNNNMYFDVLTDDDRRSDLTRMIRRDANHPCIILWSVGNEIGTQYSEYFFDTLQMLCDHVRKEDPTRPLTAALIGFVIKEYNDITPLGKKLAVFKRYSEIVDVLMGNYMEQLYEKVREYGIRKPIIGSEVRMFYRHDERTMNTVDIGRESPYDIVRRHDWVCGAILWAGCDYLGESSGYPCRGWTGNPLDSTADWKHRAWYCASQFSAEPVLRLCVYDETEPWDMARGLWGFPQMRSHWKYNTVEKVLHVCAMTNCDMVKVYQNSQTVRTAYPAESRDGMAHFYIPFIPGVLRAEGYISGRKVCEDLLTTDHGPDVLRVELDRDTLPADGESVAFVDVYLEDTHGRRFCLEDKPVEVAVTGSASFVVMDSGNWMDTTRFTVPRRNTFNGHAMILLRAGESAGDAEVTVKVEGFEPRVLRLQVQ